MRSRPSEFEQVGHKTHFDNFGSVSYYLLCCVSARSRRRSFSCYSLNYWQERVFIFTSNLHFRYRPKPKHCVLVPIMGVIYPVLMFADRYGKSLVRKWRFETWNEPDLKSYNSLSFDVDTYLTYVNISSMALKRRGMKLGGPAGLFKSPPKHPLCWGLMSHCQTIDCHLSFLSFHEKGDGIGSLVVTRSVELTETLHSMFPFARNLPIVNEYVWTNDRSHPVFFFK